MQITDEEPDAMTDEMIGRVISCVAKCQKLPPEKITIDSKFEDLGIDSLDGVNILYALETEFSVSIPDDGVLGIKSVKEAVEALDKLISSGGTNEAVQTK
jgi:acyl carrier protein